MVLLRSLDRTREGVGRGDRHSRSGAGKAGREADWQAGRQPEGDAAMQAGKLADSQAGGQASWQAARRRAHGQEGNEMEELETAQRGRRASTDWQASTYAQM